MGWLCTSLIIVIVVLSLVLAVCGIGIWGLNIRLKRVKQLNQQLSNQLQSSEESHRYTTREYRKLVGLYNLLLPPIDKHVKPKLLDKDRWSKIDYE